MSNTSENPNSSRQRGAAPVLRGQDGGVPQLRQPTTTDAALQRPSGDIPSAGMGDVLLGTYKEVPVYGRHWYGKWLRMGWL